MMLKAIKRNCIIAFFFVDRINQVSYNLSKRDLKVRH